MRALLQRVRRAEVRVDGSTVGRIGPGLLVLLGVGRDDGPDDAGWLARKCAGLRVFDDDDGAMNLSVTDMGGEVLVVSQFTLYGDARRGRRPSWAAAAPPEHADPLVQSFCEALESEGLVVARGRFGAHMEVELVNDGPVTVLVESASG